MNEADRQTGTVQIDLEAAGGIDADRLARALQLVARRVSRGRYRVDGGREAHWVDLYTRRLPRCDCGDHLWRDRVCKHILAALLHEGDPRVLAAAGRLVRSLGEELRQLRQAVDGRDGNRAA